MQCDKRNTYRRKVKEEKAAAAPADGESEGPKDNGALTTTNGHAAEVDDERPTKKFKGQSGEVVAPEPDAMDDADEDGQEDADENADEDEDDDVPDDDVDDVDEDEVQDETMDEPGEEVDGRGELRDEALDEPDSDSD